MGYGGMGGSSSVPDITTLGYSDGHKSRLTTDGNGETTLVGNSIHDEDGMAGTVEIIAGRAIPFLPDTLVCHCPKGHQIFNFPPPSERLHLKSIGTATSTAIL